MISYDFRDNPVQIKVFPKDVELECFDECFFFDNVMEIETTDKFVIFTNAEGVFVRTIDEMFGFNIIYK